ncbi:type 1 glutamine amidotransferase [Spirosoma luteum]|uniref:type 1 glutamine amidotransferase n=1 Tax=Spirosoma luteum TaxID=431553 RepID=UPI00037026F2|nr:homoserine O-succinyltransferase [Spirosoma luteum]
MNSVKIAVLDMNNKHANESMRCIMHLIRNAQGENHQSEQPSELTVDVFDIRGSNDVPDLSYDIYISSGGPGSPMPSDEAWEQDYFTLIDQLFDWNRHNDRKKFVFLICHSFQLVVRHLELGLLSQRKSTSFGIFPVHKTEEGDTAPILTGLDDPFFAVDSRDYQVTEPNAERLEQLGAQVLCLEKYRPHVPLDRAVMAIRFSPEIVGTQFHPEADNEGMLRYFQTAEKRNHIVLNFGQEKYDDMVAYLLDPDKIALTESVIIPGFLREAIQALSVTAEEPQSV